MNRPASPVHKEMTGFCGAIGVSEAAQTKLYAEFQEIWTSTSLESWEDGFLCMSPSVPGIIHFMSENAETWFAGADGERHIVDRLEHFVAETVRDLFDGQVPSVPADWRGNGVVVNPSRRLVHIATEWTGTFPLYIWQTEEGLAFSSHLRPLARSIGASIDHVGALEFLRYGYTLSGRTPFTGITRLLPGQSLTYFGLGDLTEITEHSTLWTRPMELAPSEVHRLVGELWEKLRSAMALGLPEAGRCGIMMSGGWDSRTLLAVLLDIVPRSRVVCYSHGDTESRELRLVKMIADSAGVGSSFETIDGEVWMPESLQSRFAKTENVCFPSWHAAGRKLRESEVTSVTSGVYGPSVGGHYGVTSVQTGARRTLALLHRVGRHYAGRLSGYGSSSEASEETDAAYQLLRTDSVGSHWYLREGFEDAIEDVESRLNTDLAASLSRFKERGVVGLDALLEAFNSEHRGSQFINAQLLSCRPDVDVVFPLIDRCVLQLATRLPIELKLHNYLNQQLLQRRSPDLLAFPMGATLVKGSRPIWLQEVSRLVRKIVEDFQWNRYLERGEDGAETPSWGWVNFEFLRDGRAFRRIRRDLRSEIWDMSAIRTMEENISTFRYTQRLHPVYDQMSRIYTLDLLLR